MLVKNSVDSNQLASLFLKENIEFGKNYACIELIRLKMVGSLRELKINNSNLSSLYHPNIGR